MRKYEITYLNDAQNEIKQINACRFDSITVPSRHASTTVTFYNDSGCELCMFTNVKKVELMEDFGGDR